MAFLMDLSQKKEHHSLKQDCFPHLLPSPDSLPSPQGLVFAVTRTSPAWLGKLNFISVLRKNNWRAKVITTVSLKFVALKFHSIWKSLPCIKLAKRFWQHHSGNWSFFHRFECRMRSDFWSYLCTCLSCISLQLFCF